MAVKFNYDEKGCIIIDESMSQEQKEKIQLYNSQIMNSIDPDEEDVEILYDSSDDDDDDELDEFDSDDDLDDLDDDDSDDIISEDSEVNVDDLNDLFN